MSRFGYWRSYAMDARPELADMQRLLAANSEQAHSVQTKAPASINMGCCSSSNFQQLAGTQSLHEFEEAKLQHFEQRVLHEQLQALTGKLELGWDWNEVQRRCRQATTGPAAELLRVLEAVSGPSQASVCGKLMLACVLTSSNSNYEKANALVTAVDPLSPGSLSWLVSAVLSLSTDFLPGQWAGLGQQTREYLAWLSSASRTLEAALLSELVEAVPRLEKDVLVKALVRSEQLQSLLSSSATRQLLAKHARFTCKPPLSPAGPTAPTPQSANKFDQASDSSSKFSLDSSVDSNLQSGQSLSSFSPVPFIEEAPHKTDCFMDDSFLEDVQRLRSSTTPGPLGARLSCFQTPEAGIQFWPKTPALRGKFDRFEGVEFKNETAYDTRLTTPDTGLRVPNRRWTVHGKTLKQ